MYSKIFHKLYVLWHLRHNGNNNNNSNIMSKELGNIVIIKFLHTEDPGCALAETVAEAWSKYFILLYLIGFLGTVYNLTAVIHTGPALRVSSAACTATIPPRR